MATMSSYAGAGPSNSATDAMCMWLMPSSMCRNEASCGLMRSMRSPLDGLRTAYPSSPHTRPMLDCHVGCLQQGLQHHAIPLGAFEQPRQLFIVGVCVELETQPDVGETHWCLPVHTQGAPEVEVAFSPHDPPRHWDVEGGGNSPQGDTGAGGQRLEEHVA